MTSTDPADWSADAEPGLGLLPNGRTGYAFTELETISIQHIAENWYLEECIFQRILRLLPGLHGQLQRAPVVQQTLQRICILAREVRLGLDNHFLFPDPLEGAYL